MLDATTLADVLILLGFLCVSALLASAEFAFFSVSSDELAGLGDKRSRLLLRMLAEPQELMIKLLVGSSICNIMTALFALRIAWRAFPTGHARGIASAVVLLAVSVLIATFGRLLPRIYVAHNPESAALNLARPIFVIFLPIYPVFKGVFVLTRGFFLAGLQARELILRAGQLRAMAKAGAEGETGVKDEQDMIDAIFEMRDTAVREIMVPRIDMVVAEISTTVGEAIKIIAEGGHTRLPVYDKTIDNTVGILHARDLFKHVAAGLGTTVGGIMREAYFVPETKKVRELLKELRRRKSHMAIVVDEFGGVVGLATLEDVIEEIVGEIYEEHEKEARLAEVVSDDSVRVDGKVKIEDLNRLLGTHIKKEEDYDTIAGFLYHLIGKVPAEGEEYQADAVGFVVEKVTGQRIERVLIKCEGIGRKTAPEPGDSP